MTTMPGPDSRAIQGRSNAQSVDSAPSKQDY